MIDVPMIGKKGMYTFYTRQSCQPFYFFFSSSFGGSGLGVGSLNCEHAVSFYPIAPCVVLLRDTHSLRLPVVSWSDLFPRGGASLKVSECLCQLQGLNHYPLLLLVISDLSVAREREVLSQWMAIESVIGHDSSQIWVVDEEYSEQIVDLPLVPVGTIV